VYFSNFVTQDKSNNKKGEIKDMIEEAKISKAIADTYYESFTKALNSDVIIVGAGPSGLVAAYYLAREGIKTTVLERQLNAGGGMSGGGIMMNQIVFQEEGKELLEEFDITYKKYENGYYTANSIESVSALTFKAIKAGAQILNLMSVEDVIIKEKQLAGLVVNRTVIEKIGLHVDPIMMESQYVLDATGHDAVVVNKLIDCMGNILDTADGKIQGEAAMWAEQGEKDVIVNTREAFPGLFVSGMAANATFGGYRMGPIFGGMLLSGRKAAIEITECLKNK